jgi:hypothetical protein
VRNKELPVAVARVARTFLALILTSPCTLLAGNLTSGAVELYRSLTPEQKSKAVLTFEDPARKQELFPGGVRAGIQIRDLAGPQREMALGMLKSFVSEYGAKKAEQIAGQEGKDGLLQYYVCFFGEPGEGRTYAWRIAEHHLTVVQVQVVDGRAAEFGPVLLGANPSTLWDAEEDALIDLYASLSPEEQKRATLSGKSDSAKPYPKGAGIAVKELNPTAREKVAAMFKGRLGFLSDEIGKEASTMLEKQGGLDAMRIVYWNKAEKRCRDGGKWDFKLGGENFLCDYENTRGHIHLSMKGRLGQQKD